MIYYLSSRICGFEPTTQSTGIMRVDASIPRNSTRLYPLDVVLVPRRTSLDSSPHKH